MLQAEIITIGDELLIGQVVNTNAAWIGRELSRSGFDVARVTSVTDTREAIISILNEATARSKVVLLTGGLGPTRDDITKDTLCEFFDTPLVFNREVFHDMELFLKGRVKNINSLNRHQAMVPAGCTVIRNPMGTAPAMWFNGSNGGVVVSMPGVPPEMKQIMSREVLPRLKQMFYPGVILHKTILVYNIPEAELAQRLATWELSLPPSLKLAYLPSPGRIRLRLTGHGTNEESLRREIDEAVRGLQPIIGEHIYGEEDLPAPEVFAAFFSRTGSTLALAESCSGGYLSHLVTSIAGASRYFKGGFVTYSNQLKENILGVDRGALTGFGAVSRQVAEEMARGALRISNANYSIATTGIAGPGGGTPQKPVGTVWIAWANDQGAVKSAKYNFGTDRSRVILRTSEMALIELMQMMKKEEL